MSKEFFIEEIGIVKITKKRGVKRMTLRVKPFSPINITVPYTVTFNSAISFVKEKKEWIINSRKKISETENKRTKFTSETKFQTKKRELVFIPSQHTQIYITKTKITVEYSKNEDLLSAVNQDYIRKGIVEALRIEAKEYLPARTEHLAEKYEFNYNNVTVRNAKTRWGSCSGQNNISLNLHLMRLPEILIDYVILHELCHTVEKNHGKNFWLLLDKVSGNARGLDKQLKQYSPSIF
ncbi:MAG: M48 family metallopeptidase [Bacteroidales bacterium]|nr:M48 family metallopeptidase [Bacteroidales bacterium]